VSEVEKIFFLSGLLARLLPSVVLGFIMKEDRVSVNSENQFYLDKSDCQKDTRRLASDLIRIKAF
jgi:hypothetical protein